MSPAEILIGGVLLVAAVASFHRFYRERPAKYPVPSQPIFAEAMSEWWRKGEPYRDHAASGDVQFVPGPELLAWVQSVPRQWASQSLIDPTEWDWLEKRFYDVMRSLAAFGLISLTALLLSVAHDGPAVGLFLVGGLFGSSIAAFRSCLDRRANGFEDQWGGAAPDPGVEKGRFSEAMAKWLLLRPLLGVLVAGAVFLGIHGEVFDFFVGYDAFIQIPARVAFYGTLVGLFAKTILELLLKGVKRVFGM